MTAAAGPGSDLPLVGSLPVDPHASESCITCGDVAVALTVIEVLEGDARCRADDGGEELVATELVGPLRPGDRVLVHARVALEKLGDQEGTR